MGHIRHYVVSLLMLIAWPRRGVQCINFGCMIAVEPQFSARAGWASRKKIPSRAENARLSDSQVYFAAAAGPHLPTPEASKAELYYKLE